MERSRILEIVNLVLAKRGVEAVSEENLSTHDAHFRSLDFSETALRVEEEIGRELSFEASSLRQIQSIADVLDFFQVASAGDGN